MTSEGAWLRKDGANLVVEVEGVEQGRAPLHMLEGVVGFGRPGASPALMAACAEAGIALSFCDPNGRFQARVEGPRSGNVLLRRTQYRVADDPVRSTALVRNIVAAKVANQRTVLRRGLRDHGDGLAPDVLAAQEHAAERLAYVARRTVIALVGAVGWLDGQAAHAAGGHPVGGSADAARSDGRGGPRSELAQPDRRAGADELGPFRPHQ